jgi:hypothetical protein
MESKADPPASELRREIVRAMVLLVFAVAVPLFIDKPPDVRAWMWWALRIAVLLLTATELAHAVWRWNRYKN